MTRAIGNVAFFVLAALLIPWRASSSLEFGKGAIVGLFIATTAKVAIQHGSPLLFGRKVRTGLPLTPSPGRLVTGSSSYWRILRAECACVPSIALVGAMASKEGVLSPSIVFFAVLLLQQLVFAYFIWRMQVEACRSRRLPGGACSG